MTIENLTPEQKQALLQELENEQKAVALQTATDKQTLKDMADQLVEENATMAIDAQAVQNSVLNQVFKNFEAYIALKQKLYHTNEAQATHTVTHRNGLGSLTFGYREKIGFDGTESAGVEMIKEYIGSLSADDEKRGKLGKMVEVYIKTNQKGKLNPTKIVDLFGLKPEMNSELFNNGVDTIMAAQFKTRTKIFLSGWMRVTDEAGAEKKLHFSLSMS